MHGPHILTRRSANADWTARRVWCQRW